MTEYLTETRGFPEKRNFTFFVFLNEQNYKSNLVVIL